MKKPLALYLGALLISNAAFAGTAKRVIRLAPVTDKYIELDDGARYGMGENLYNRLVTELQTSGKFEVVVAEPWKPKSSADPRVALSTNAEPGLDPSDRLHFEFAPVPAADFSASVEQLTFTHGSRGIKRYAGYGTDFKTPFNDGSFDAKNEFPARSLELVSSWFGTSFDPIGNAATNTIAGVETGNEGEFNLIVASAYYRRDSYLATAKVSTALRLAAEQVDRPALIDTTGTGFLFAMGGSYREITLGFGIAKRDALKQTFDQSVQKMAENIETELFAIPFRTKIERNGSEGIILNAGRREGIKVGDLFQHKANGVVSTLKVVEAFLIGSHVEVVSGGKDFQIGDIVTLNEPSIMASAGDLPDNREVATPGDPPPATHSHITIDPPEFHDPDGNVSKGLNAKGLLLPYLLWRWSQYDQEIDQKMELKPQGDLFAAAQTRWNLGAIHVADAWKRGLRGKGVKVAVIDSGVDYNHKNLAQVLARDYAGFDFMSHDEKPFDDNSHGTAIAGLIGAQAVEKNQVGIAPGAQILAYKAFDPYGGTTSAALYGAFDRAIKDGAKIIVCGWDTRHESQALTQAVALAEAKGVLVVSAAGDQGEDISGRAHYPAQYSRSRNNVIAVAATDKTGALTTVRSRYSNYGKDVVDIAAPGGELEVLSPRSEYLTRTGSDLAAAHVAGVAALVWEQHPDYSAEQVKAAVLRGAAINQALSALVGGGRVLDAEGATR